MGIAINWKGNAWFNFLDTETAPQTKKFYARWIGLFMAYCGITEPDKLLELGTVQETEDLIINWLGTLKDSGKATATMKGGLASVAFFYSCNRKRIDTRFIARRIPRRPTIPHRSPTKEEVIAIVECTNMRGKALTGLLASSGVRVGAIPPLKLRHRRRLLLQELEHRDCSCKDRSQVLMFNGYILKVYEGESEQYFTFVSEEASKWLDSYHKMRQNAGEVMTPNSPLFREEFDVSKPKVVKEPLTSTEGALKTFMARAAITAGVKPVVKLKEKLPSGAFRSEWKNLHGYRMFFSTAATNASVNFSFKEMMLGHHLNLEKLYYDSNNPHSVHAALAEYLKMQDAVTLYSLSKMEKEIELAEHRLVLITIPSLRKARNPKELMEGWTVKDLLYLRVQYLDDNPISQRYLEGIIDRLLGAASTVDDNEFRKGWRNKYAAWDVDQKLAQLMKHFLCIRQCFDAMNLLVAVKGLRKVHASKRALLLQYYRLAFKLMKRDKDYKQVWPTIRSRLVIGDLPASTMEDMQAFSSLRLPVEACQCGHQLRDHANKTEICDTVDCSCERFRPRH